MPRQYFTLIELLVVVVLCFVLVLMVNPFRHHHREGSRRINCASNLKQITRALMMFANEHAEKFPYEVSSRELGLTGDVIGETRTLAVGGREGMFLEVVSGSEEIPAQITAGDSARRSLSGGLADRRVNQWFFNLLFGNANPDGTELVGGSGVLPDARVFVCPSSKNPMTLPQDPALIPDDLSYGSNFAVRGKTSVPNVISVGDRCRQVGGKAIAGAVEPGEARGRNHMEEGFNFGFKDGHVKWSRGASGVTAVRLTVSESSDRGDIFVADGAKNNVEDIVFF